jgi:hypothetical protein
VADSVHLRRARRVGKLAYVEPIVERDDVMLALAMPGDAREGRELRVPRPKKPIWG